MAASAAGVPSPVIVAIAPKTSPIDRPAAWAIGDTVCNDPASASNVVLPWAVASTIFEVTTAASDAFSR